MNEAGFVEKPDLSGSWVLNEALSDDPREQIKAAIKKGRGNMGGKGGRGHGKGKGRNGTGRGGEGQNAEGQGSPLKKFVETMILVKTLELTHEEPSLLIITDGENQQHVYTDNRGSSISANNAGRQKVVTAGWERDILIVEITSNNGPRLIQQYKLNTEPRQLWVSTTVQQSNSKSPIVIKRLYDPAKNNAQ